MVQGAGFEVLCCLLLVLCSVFCVLCSVFCVLCSVFCVLCSVFCVLCSVFCVLCSVFCVLCPVFCALWPEPLVFLRNKCLFRNRRSDISHVVFQRRHFQWFGGQILIRNERKEMIDTIESCSLFVISMYNIPW
jgi:hypothetical protein